MAKRGRPTVWNPEREQLFLQAAAQGYADEDCARAAILERTAPETYSQRVEVTNIDGQAPDVLKDRLERDEIYNLAAAARTNPEAVAEVEGRLGSADFVALLRLGSAIASAVYNETNHVTGAAVAGPVACTVSGSTVTTPNITWSAVGQYLVELKVTFVDGTVDNSLGTYVNVGPVPT